MTDIINPKNYFAAIVSILIIIGIAVGAAVYGLFVGGPEDVVVEDVRIINGDDGIPTAVPTGLEVPSIPPSVPAPSEPPPGI